MTTDTLTLRELSDEVLTLDDFIREADGELSPEIESLMTDVAAKLELKVEGIGRFVITEGDRIDAIKAEEARLAARRRAIENRIAWLKNSYLREILSKLGTDKLKGTLCTVALQKNPPSVVGTLDEHALRELAMIDERLVRHIPEQFSLDRRAALDALKAGNTIPGLAIVQTDSVRIR